MGKNIKRAALVFLVMIIAGAADARLGDTGPFKKKTFRPADRNKAADVNEELRSAVTANDLAKVKKIFADAAKGGKIDINKRVPYQLGESGDSGTTTLLLIAIEKQNTEMVQFLIARKAGVNAAEEPFKVTPLMRAVNGQPPKFEIATAVLDARPDINAKDKNGRTALMYACLGGPPHLAGVLEKEGLRIVSMLIKSKISINEKDIFGLTALNYARDNNFIRIAALLEKNGALEGVPVPKGK